MKESVKVKVNSREIERLVGVRKGGATAEEKSPATKAKREGALENEIFSLDCLNRAKHNTTQHNKELTKYLDRERNGPQRRTTNKRRAQVSRCMIRRSGMEMQKEEEDRTGQDSTG